MPSACRERAAYRGVNVAAVTAFFTVAVRSASAIAVSAIGALAPLGFIHEDFGMAFVPDIADLFRGRFTLPIEFKAVKSLGTPTRDF